MNVGLPGTGIGGMFFVISALLTLPIELARFCAGRSSTARLKLALRHAAIAVAMIGVLTLSFWGLRAAVAAVRGQTHAGGTALTHVLPIAPMLLTVTVLAAILLAAYLHHLVRGVRQASPSDER